MNRKNIKGYLSKNQRLVPGIYGGMGPMAHIHFEQLLLSESTLRGATHDQEHPVWLVASGSATPDRTQSLKGTHSAYNHLHYFCSVLENSGADFIVMICNTANAYTDILQKELSIPVISIVELTAQYIAKTYSKVTSVGLLATTGTIEARLYQEALVAFNVEVICPNSSSNQQKVMNAIYHTKYGIKSTGTRISTQAQQNLNKVIDTFIDQGVQVVIAGCTEISLALNANKNSKCIVVDPLQITAKKVLELCFSEGYRRQATTKSADVLHLFK